MKLSTCCGAETEYEEYGICPECQDHCDFEDAEEEEQGVKTATRWLFDKLWEMPKDKMTWYAILKQAEEMHKHQVKTAHQTGWVTCAEHSLGFDVFTKDSETYYNESYPRI
jgi:hypothetical protein